MEPLCGRPKGMKINPIDGLLYVADSYKGLMTVNLTDGQTAVLLKGLVILLQLLLSLNTFLIYFPIK